MIKKEKEKRKRTIERIHKLLEKRGEKKPIMKIKLLAIWFYKNPN